MTIDSLYDGIRLENSMYQASMIVHDENQVFDPRKNQCSVFGGLGPPDAVLM